MIRKEIILDYGIVIQRFENWLMVHGSRKLAHEPGCKNWLIWEVQPPPMEGVDP